MEEARVQGLYVDILLAGHYTPSWLFNKYGDIRMYTWDGHSIEKGEYLTFSMTSPAVSDQIEWQQKCVKHYSVINNVFLFQYRVFTKEKIK